MASFAPAMLLLLLITPFALGDVGDDRSFPFPAFCQPPAATTDDNNNAAVVLALLLCAGIEINNTEQTMGSSFPNSTIPKMVYVGCASVLADSAVAHVNTALNYTLQGNFLEAGEEACSAETELATSCPLTPFRSEQFRILRMIMRACCKVFLDAAAGGAAPVDGAAAMPESTSASIFFLVPVFFFLF